jgi:hypothetical protein
VLIEKLVASAKQNPSGVRFTDAVRIASHYFGPPRIKGSHHVFNMPWSGLPVVNLQKDGSKAKAYQVRQLLQAIEKLPAK